MDTSWVLLGVVGLRVVAGTGGYVCQKKLADPRWGDENPGAVVTSSYLLMSVALIAAVPFLDWGPALQWEFWQTMLWVPALEAVGSIMSLYALRATELSLFGPLNAYKAPISIPVSAAFRDEYPNRFGVLGVSLVFLGSLLLKPPKVTGQRWRDVLHLLVFSDARWRLGSMFLFAVSGVFLKTGVEFGGTLLSACVWVWVGCLTSVVAGVFVRSWRVSEALRMVRRHQTLTLTNAGCLIALQVTTHYTFGATLVGYALAVFQLGMLLQVPAGRVFFNEREWWPRMSAAAVMFLGSVLVVWLG